MTKKITFIIAFLTACAYSAGTVIEVVNVPIKLLRLVSSTSNVYEYTGKITYDLRVGDFDSLNTTLDFIPATTGSTGPTITPYEVTGAVGIRSFVNGINGQNDVYFKCRTTGAPAETYMARITIVAVQSRIEKITDSLTNLMSNDEIVSQLHGTGSRWSGPITRLGIPGYCMSNGPLAVCVGVSGTSSTFPAPSTMACSFDTALIYRMGEALAKEYWAKGKYIIEAPTVNLMRDSRNGRSFEEFGEDPFLSALASVAYCKGVQSTKGTVMPKHWVCNDHEVERTTSSSNISERSLREVYAMPFEYSVKEAKAWSIMSAFNKVNGAYCDSNSHILTDILKTDWGFRGYVCSDWGSMHSTAQAANAGQDVELVNSTYFGTPLLNAVSSGQVTPARLKDMFKRLLRTEVWGGVIGQIGSTGQVTKRYTADLSSPAHETLCRDIAKKSMILVKNDKFGTETAPVLPLSKTAKVAVIGPYATIAQLGGTGSALSCPYYSVTYAQGITNKIGSANIVSSWQNADVVVVVVGVESGTEGEHKERSSLDLVASQNTQVNDVVNGGKKCVVVVTGGSALTKGTWANAPAIVIAGFAGEEQGNALADVLFGDFNPCGRASFTWPASTSQLPTWNYASSNAQLPYERVDTGRGYRYFDRTKQTPFIPFGHGLSYTTFQYSNLIINPNPAIVGQIVTVTVDITNTGSRAGDEVAQLYLSEAAPKLPRPVKELRGFAKVSLAAGAKQTVSFTLRERELAYFDDGAGVNRFVVQPDNYTIAVGPSSANLPITGTLKVE